MTLDEAKRRILTGAKLGEVFPLLQEADGFRLKKWFTETEGVPNLKDRVKVNGLPSGNPCKECGGYLVRTGTCETCSSCGSSSGGCS